MLFGGLISKKNGIPQNENTFYSGGSRSAVFIFLIALFLSFLVQKRVNKVQNPILVRGIERIKSVIPERFK